MRLRWLAANSSCAAATLPTQQAGSAQLAAPGMNLWLTRPLLTPLLPFYLPVRMLQGEGDSALDHLWAAKRAEIGQ